MMMKRVLSLLLAVVLLMGSAAGCGQKDAGGDTQAAGTDAVTTEEQKPDGSAAGTEAAEAADPLGKYEEPVKVMMINQLSDDMSKQLETIGETVDDNRWIKRYKDRLNIDIEHLWVAKPEAYTEKFNLMLVSGDLPDILKVNAVQFRQLLEADMLEDLTDVYNTYMNEDYKKVAESDPYMMASSTFEGRIMGIPTEPTKPYSNTQQIWIRSDWLEKLNLPEPKTMDDVIELARKFMEAKPDGADTYGIAFDKDSFSPAAATIPGFPGFANSYHAYPDIWIESEAGSLTYGSLAPEVKNALESMRALYEEGIIDKEFATKDATQYNQDLISGKVGITYNWLGFALSINDMKKLNPEAEFKAYEIVSVDEGEALPQANATVDFWYVVRKGYEHPEALIKMANLEIATLITSEAKDQAPDGTTNSEYYGAPKDAPSMFDVVNFWFSLVPDENSTRYDVYEAVMKRDPSNVRSNDLSIYENLIAYEEGDLAQWGWNRTFGGPGGGAEITQKYKAENKLKVNAYFGLPTETMTERQATLNQLQAETFTKIVMGEVGLEAFDEFTEKWLALGGQDITDEVNEWYEANK